MSCFVISNSYTFSLCFSLSCLPEPNTLFLFGGRDRHSQDYVTDITKVTLRRTPAGHMRDTLTDIVFDDTFAPKGRMGLTAIALDEKLILLFGGRQRIEMTTASSMFSDETVDPVYIFDIVNSKFFKPTIHGNIPEARAHHTTTKAGNSIYVIGGVQYLSPTKTVRPPSYKLTFDILSLSFTSTLVDIPQPCRLAHHSSAVLGNHIVLCGGYCEDSKSLNKTTYFIPIGDESNISTLPTELCNVSHISIVCHSKLYVFGGENNHNVWELSSSNNPEALNAIDNDDDDIAAIPDDDIAIAVIPDDDIADIPDDDIADIPDDDIAVIPPDEEADLISEENDVEAEEEDDEDEVVDNDSVIQEEIVMNEDGAIEDADVCGSGDLCTNVHADQSIANEFLECDTCNKWFHLHCQGFDSIPFADIDDKEDCIFHCLICRTTVRLSSRQRSTLNENNGIIRPHRR